MNKSPRRAAASNGPSPQPGKESKTLPARVLKISGWIGSGIVALVRVVAGLVAILEYGEKHRSGTGPDASLSGADRQPSRDRIFRNTLDLLSAIAGDLESLPENERPQRRYCTLVHLHNNRNVPETDLENTRELLRQTVHSLALTSGTEELKVIDPDRTIFAFNLSLWGWKDEDWRRLLKKYPYGLDATESANPSLRARDDQVQRLSQSLLCHVRGDWLIQELVRLSPQPQTPAWATLSRSEAIQVPGARVSGSDPGSQGHGRRAGSVGGRRAGAKASR